MKTIDIFESQKRKENFSFEVHVGHVVPTCIYNEYTVYIF